MEDQPANIEESKPWENKVKKQKKGEKMKKGGKRSDDQVGIDKSWWNVSAYA